jgi:hypothetical protein
MTDRDEYARLVLDESYTTALLGAAVDGGLAHFEGYSEASGRAYHDLFLDSRASKRLQSRALEMALLSDRVDLFGVPVALNTRQLRQTGLLGLELAAGQVFDFPGSAQVPTGFVREVKPMVIRHIHRRNNLLLRRIGLVTLPYRASSRGYDALILAAEADVDFWKLRQDTFSKLIVDPGAISESDLPNRELAVDMIVKVAKELDGGMKTVPHVVVAILGSLHEVLNFWTSLLHSVSFSEPLLSRFMTESGRFDLSSTPANAEAAYRVCRIAMHNKLHYAPVVESIDDVLRLREHPSIRRFRGLLQKWSGVVQSGEVPLLAEVTRDIEKANAEIRSLDRWRRVDRWLYWLQLPTVLIPIISSLVTVVAFSCRAWIERTEEKNSWITIGR